MEDNGKYAIKPLKDLHIDFDFMFMLVMQEKSICKKVAEILLDIKIRDIIYTETQKEGRPFYISKSVRFDAFIANTDKVINIEMQSSHYANLMLRARYYQSMLDVSLLKAGESYENLQESYLLFICKDDPFYKGLPVYTIKPYCQELLDFSITDRTQKKFFACKFYEKIAESDIALKAFMEYIYTYKATNDFTKVVDNFIEDQKRMEENIVKYSNFNMVEMDARIAGKKEGIQEGVSSIVKGMLANNLDYDIIKKCTGLSYEQIRALQ